MTYTTDQAIALAREVGATMSYQSETHSEFDINSEELTALCNAVFIHKSAESEAKNDAISHKNCVIVEIADGCYLTSEDIENMCKEVRRKTLLEAAALCEKRADKDMFGFPNDAQGYMELFRRMAGVE